MRMKSIKEQCVKKKVKLMYKVNDTVLYGAYGVCKITEIAEKNFNGNYDEYYILKPIFSEQTTIFIPIYNKILAEKMRRVLSTDEIRALIKMMPDENIIWIENENIRRERYKEIISSASPSDLVRLIKTLYLHKQTQKEKGRKLHIADGKFLKDAEKMLCDEFAFVLNIKRDQVLPLILEQIQLDEKN